MAMTAIRVSLSKTRRGTNQTGRQPPRRLWVEPLEGRWLLDADLAIVKSDSSDPVVAGTSFSYSIEVKNNGPSDAGDVTVSDTLPGELKFNAGASSPGCTAVGQVVTCVLGSLGSGLQKSLTVAVDVQSSVADGAELSNTATVTGTEADPDPGNNTSTATTTVHRETDLAITKDNSASSAVAGTVFSYTIHVTNNGPSDASGVTVSDTLTSELTFSAAASSPECTATGQAVTCAIGTVASGSQKTLTVAVRVASSVPEGAILLNLAMVAGTESDPDSSNNFSTVFTPVTRETDLAISKTESTDPVSAGGSFSYNIKVTNNGPSDASGVTVNDLLPLELTFDAGPGCFATDQFVTCTIGDLPSGSNTTMIVSVIVGSLVPDGSVVTNTANVTGNETDPVLANNRSTETTSVNVAADLAIVKDDSADPVIAGTSFSYTIEVTNNGPSDATVVTVSDTLPTGLTFKESGSSEGCSAVGQVVTCVIGALTASSETTVTLAVDVEASLPHGTNLSNTATVSALQADTTPGNNSSTETTTVHRQADLAVLKNDSADPVLAGTSFSYSLEVTNHGPSNASGVTVSDTLPAGLTFNAAGSSAGCSAVGQAVSCVLGSLSSGAQTTLTLAVVVSSSVIHGAVLSNTATIRGDETDLALINNSSTESTRVNRQANLVIVKGDSADPVVAGTSFTYSIQVTNEGPSDASGVIVSDTLPGGLTFITDSSSAGCSALAQAVTCVVGVLTSGSVASLTVAVSVAPSVLHGSLLVNTASVVGTETDPTPAENSDTESTIVNREVDLSVGKTASTPLVQPGSGSGNLTYTVTVTNKGPSDASGVTLSEDLTLPSCVSVDSVTPSLGTFATTTVPDGTWTVGNLMSGSSATLTVVITVSGTATFGSNVISNTATVSSSNETLIKTGDDSATVNTSVGAFDFGDAPDPLAAVGGQYPTLFANNGARHMLGSGLFLGSTVDAERDGQPNAGATGDDAAGDDEDGVVLPATIVVRLGVTATVTASGAGKLDAWVDFDRDGIFETDEQVATSLSIHSGGNALVFTVPPSASAGTAFARFRLSSAGGLAPTGEAADGEVEDYAVQISTPPDCSVAVIADPSHAAQSLLMILGTSGNDSISLKPRSGETMVSVRGTNCRLSSPIATSTFQRIVIFAGAGSDKVQLARVASPASVFGEAGNDKITGGSGNNILVGGSGNDKLQGGTARDIIIGGTGADNLTASNFDDLLVAGTTDHDASDAALSLILAEWRRNDAGYSARLDHLTGNAGSGLNLTFLLNNQTAHDDNVRDVLRGENDFDWFLANVVGTGIADRVIAAPGEVTTDIDP